MKSTAQKVLMMGLVSASTVFSGALMGCAKTSAGDSASSVAEDSSASGAAAGAVGGALSSSTSSGTMAETRIIPRSDFFAQLKSSINPLPKAMADELCPTFRSTASQCSVSGTSMWLDYSSCVFQGRVSWTGTQEITMSAGTAACGTFPNPGASGILYRKFVTAQNSSTAGSATLVTNSKTMTVDDASANLANFDGDTIAQNSNSAYGSAVTFNSSGLRSQLQVDHHISVTGAYDHSITGTLSLSESSDGTTRTVNGPLTVYHNLLRVIGTSTFTNVVHDNVCCLPVSGEIQTVFSAGAHQTPTVQGAAMVGGTETLTFTGCGTATYTSVNGTSSSVTLDRCF